ncbi:hypothetical protein [Gluconobacter japonicus]|uniref:hypothetical protein n=1 Tax=Gluconobacter japonicus TaxID=376620 RepID=UPI0039EAB7B7
MIIDRSSNSSDHTYAPALIQALAQRLSPAHAALFATPVQEVGGTNWYSAGSQHVPISDLTPASADALLRHAASILSDIRRVANSEAGLIRTHYRQLITLPDGNSIHVVDGRPVLSRWGCGATTPQWITDLDDGRPPPQQCSVFPDPPRLWPVALMGATLGLAAGASVLLFTPATQACRDIINHALWYKQDLAAISGCWVRSSNMEGTVNDVVTHDGYKSWQLCMDSDGRHGTLNVTLDVGPDGTSCTAPALGTFKDGKAVITTPYCKSVLYTYLPRIAICKQKDNDHMLCDIHPNIADASLPPDAAKYHEGELTRSRVAANTP